MASANIGATLTTSILSILFSSAKGIVSVIINLSITDSSILLTAGPDRTG